MSLRDKERLSRIVEAFAYIAERAPANKKNMYNVLKVFYLADKLHMERYGRFIFDDSYSAMERGPVPSAAYNLIKDIRDGRQLPFDIDSPVKLGARHKVVPLRHADEDYFSGSDLLCLDEVIELSSSKDLGDLSHDVAWANAPRNKLMSDESILSTMRHSKELIELHTNRHP
ncbi:Panacea domain-containing protein [Marinimicrobium sp. C2-29]|uniref:Panacea domain-containing protein n=1 Tax=Marinimicrobium sp. C2-29 TaxID=3139825 RepID=UPI003138FC01